MPWPLAKKGLRAAEADLAAVDARIAADTARYARPPRPDAAALARAAARLDRKRALLQAEEAVLKAEMAHHEAVNAAPKQPGNVKANPAEKDAFAKLGKAREAALAARKATSDDSPNYPPLTPIYPATSTGRRLALARLDHRPRQPADGPRGGQPDLDAALRHTPGAIGIRLRPQRHAAGHPRLARLAGRAAPRPRLAA